MPKLLLLYKLLDGVWHACSLPLAAKKYVICLVDSNKIYHNKTRLGFDVRSPNELKNIEFDKILIASHKFAKEMISTIMKMKISNKKIVKLGIQLS